MTLGGQDLPRNPSHFGSLLLLCTARKHYWCLLLFKVKAESFSKHGGQEPWFPKRPLSAAPTLSKGSSSSSEISGLRQCELTYLPDAHRACLVWECVIMLRMYVYTVFVGLSTAQIQPLDGIIRPKGWCVGCRWKDGTHLHSTMNSY